MLSNLYTHTTVIDSQYCKPH